MPVFVKPILSESWSEDEKLSDFVSSDRWERTLHKTSSILVIAIKEYHYEIKGGSDDDFPSTLTRNDQFWTWFENTWQEKLIGILEMHPQTFDWVLGTRICEIARLRGIEFGWYSGNTSSLAELGRSAYATVLVFLIFARPSEQLR